MTMHSFDPEVARALKTECGSASILLKSALACVERAINFCGSHASGLPLLHAQRSRTALLDAIDQLQHAVDFSDKHDPKNGGEA